MVDREPINDEPPRTPSSRWPRIVQGTIGSILVVMLFRTVVNQQEQDHHQRMLAWQKSMSVVPLAPPPQQAVRRELWEPTLEQIEKLAKQVPDAKELKLSGDALTGSHLARCAVFFQLISLDVSNTELDDGDVRALLSLPALQTLDLSETMITDEAVNTLEQLPALVSVDVSWTDISLERIQAWTAAHDGIAVYTEKESEPLGVLGTIRWADGRRGGKFSSAYGIFSNATRDGQSYPHSRFTGQLRRRDLYWPLAYWEHGDGEYFFQLALGEAISEPVRITLADGRPTSTFIEFRMPSTKEAALKTKLK